MAYMHRVHSSEIQTGLIPVVSVPSAIPFIVGTAPVNMSDGTCNKVKYVQNYAEAVKEFGFVPAKSDASSGLKKYEYSPRSAWNPSAHTTPQPVPSNT